MVNLGYTVSDIDAVWLLYDCQNQAHRWVSNAALAKVKVKFGHLQTDPCGSCGALHDKYDLGLIIWIVVARQEDHNRTVIQC